MMTVDPLCEFFAFHFDPDNYNFMSGDEIECKYSERVSNFKQSYALLKSTLENQEFQRAMVYDAAKPYYGEDKTALKNWFMDNNLVLFNKPEGPQLANFIEILGTDNYQTNIETRLNDPLSLFVWAKDKKEK